LPLLLSENKAIRLTYRYFGEGCAFLLRRKEFKWMNALPGRMAMHKIFHRWMEIVFYVHFYSRRKKDHTVHKLLTESLTLTNGCANLRLSWDKYNNKINKFAVSLSVKLN